MASADVAPELDILATLAISKGEATPAVVLVPAIPLEHFNVLLLPERGPAVVEESRALGYLLTHERGPDAARKSLAVMFDVYQRAMLALPTILFVNNSSSAAVQFSHLVHILGVYIKVASHYNLFHFHMPLPHLTWPHLPNLLAAPDPTAMRKLLAAIKDDADTIWLLDWTLAKDVADCLRLKPAKKSPRKAAPPAHRHDHVGYAHM